MAKKPSDLYIRQYQRLDKKPKRSVRKFFLVLFIIIIFSACSYLAYLYRDLFLPHRQEPMVTIAQKETLTLYFPSDNNPAKLVEKKIEVKNNLSDMEKGQAILNRLKASKILPAACALSDLAVDSDGVMYLNFSKDITHAEDSSAAEIGKTYSIVNSFLASFRNAHKLQLLAEGHPVYTLGGAIYTYKPIEFNHDLLED